ncbi:hypothetical protein [Xenorhabdus sp. PB61.4]
MWLFVVNKKQKLWLWYVWWPCMKRIIAYISGVRSRKPLINCSKNNPCLMSFFGVLVMSMLTTCYRKISTLSGKYLHSVLGEKA